MFRLVFSIALITTPALAQYQVPIECITIANREGFGEIIQNKKELTKAKARLVWLRARHPFDKEVRECDRTVNRLILEMKKGG